MTIFIHVTWPRIRYLLDLGPHMKMNFHIFTILRSCHDLKGSDLCVHTALKVSDFCHIKVKKKNPNRFESLPLGNVNTAFVCSALYTLLKQI